MLVSPLLHLSPTKGPATTPAEGWLPGTAASAVSLSQGAQQVWNNRDTSLFRHRGP